MATLLRPPLAFSPQQKRPIAPVDYFSRPLTLGINPNAAIQQLFDSAPPRKVQVYVEALSRPLTLGINPNAAVVQLDQSAPPRKGQVYIEQALNLLSTTLIPVTTIPLPLAAEQVDDSAPRRWKLNEIEHLYPLTLGINPNAAIATLDRSAPPRKLQVTVDGVPNLLANTLTGTSLDLPLRAEVWEDSATARNRQTLANQFMGRMVWLDAIPQVLQLDQSAYRAKFQVFLEPTPNLAATTLNLVLVPNVVGETQAQAEIDLAAVGFTAGETFAYSDTVAAGLVISQAPTGGTLVPPASIVSIVISLGVQPASGQRPAGRRRRRKYIIRIEGRVFEAEDESQALAILEQAQVLAEKAATIRADEIVERALPKAIALGQVKPIAIKAPTINVSSALAAQAEATQAAIDRAYANASAAAELRMLLALMDEDDEEAFLLLH